MQKFLNTPAVKLIRNPASHLPVLAALFCLALPGSVTQAQGLFSPAITVNSEVISQYEIEQRVLLRRLLRAPGDPVSGAPRELIQDRLKLQAAAEAGIVATEEDVTTGIEDFAGRTNLTSEQFLQVLAENGIEPETMRDFVRAGITWREFVATQFLSRARPTEAEIDRAVGQTGSGGVQVLLSELIMPLTPENEEEVAAIAEEVSKITSFEAFSAAATQYSVTDTRFDGGRMNWLAINSLPPPLRPILLALKPGEVTAPLPLQNAVGLFQLRDIREVSAGNPKYAAIEYASYYIPGGRSSEALSRAKAIRDQVDSCDDLYGIAFGQPETVLDRQSQKPSEIPSDIALELAKLDPGESSTALTRNSGQTLVFLMLCGRTGELAGDASREDIANALTQQRLTAFSDSYLSQLEADAIIKEK